jgi:CheY-like chemotaxis protein
VELGEHLERIYADRSQVEQVLLNLVVNARDAMPEGGTLTMRTATVEVTPREARSNPDASPGQYVCLAVSDSGCGMDKGTLARIFEPFFTTKGAGKGTGMGLATTYGIIKQSKGHIRVESEPSKGTTFYIHFPRHLQALTPARFDAGPQRNLTGTETVLVVEDEDVIRSLVRSILEVRGYKVLDAATGAEALRLCGNPSQAIDLLLTDVIMPKMNGRELADRFVQIHPDAKVLYMSGYTESVIGGHGVLEHGVEMLQKPFSSQELATKVRDVLDVSTTSAGLAHSTR